MKTIDIHAHIVPDSLWRAVAARQNWHGYSHEAGEGLGTMIGCGGARTAFASPKVKYAVEQRLQDMDAQKVDMQVLSIHTPLGGYHLEPEQGLARPPVNPQHPETAERVPEADLLRHRHRR